MSTNCVICNGTGYYREEARAYQHRTQRCWCCHGFDHLGEGGECPRRLVVLGGEH